MKLVLLLFFWANWAVKRDGDISWTMTSRGHYFLKCVTSRGHSQKVTFRYGSMGCIVFKRGIQN